MPEGTRPEPPPWLNLDEVMPPDLRARLWALADEVQALAPTLAELADRCARALIEADGHRPPAPGVESPTTMFGPYTGELALFEALNELGDLLVDAASARPAPTEPAVSQ